MWWPVHINFIRENIDRALFGPVFSSWYNNIPSFPLFVTDVDTEVDIECVY